MACNLSVHTRSSASDFHVTLVGEVWEKFLPNVLPNNRETLQVFFYHYKKSGKTIAESAWATANELIPFWTEKSRIPVIQNVHVFEKIRKLFFEWKGLMKNHARRTDTQITNEAAFDLKLKRLFDIAISNALEIMMNEEDKAFLIAQRGVIRQGKISPVKDRLLAIQENEATAKEIRRQERLMAEQRHKLKYESRERVTLADSLEVEFSSCSSQEESDVEYRASQKRGRKNIITPELATSCDGIGLSNRNAAVIISFTVHALGHNLDEYSTSYAVVRRKREENRAMVTKKIQNDFTPDPSLTLHFDGKIVPDLVGKQRVDRIAVVVTGITTDQLIGVPKILAGTGEATARAGFSALQDWDINDNIKAPSFDTTSVNTGIWEGAIIYLVEYFGRKLLMLACRHHTPELFYSDVFIYHYKPSGGPDIPLFKRFLEFWLNIDPTLFDSGIANDEVMAALRDDIDELIHFAMEQIKTFQPRDDYLELLSLSIIFLGGVPPKGVKFMAPGAFNKTRWMCKAIYSLKIWMFRNQFRLTKQEEKGLRQINIFTVKVYIKYWFRAPHAVGAPYNDRQLINTLIKFKAIDSVTTNIALRKVSRHLWYLSETLVPLALFDKRLSVEEKRLCVRNMKENEGLPDPPIRLPIYAEECGQLPELFTTNSMNFFSILDIPHSFLEEDPINWNDNVDYQKSLKVANGLRVVNDHAERAVKLMQSRNRMVTFKEKGYQELLQVTSHFQKKY